MRFIIAVRGEVDDQSEALAVRTAVDTALIPFEELGLKTTSEVSSVIEPPPEPE